MATLKRDGALDQHPTQIFEVLEEGFYRPTFRRLFRGFRFVVIGHDRERSGVSDFGIAAGRLGYVLVLGRLPFIGGEFSLR